MEKYNPSAFLNLLYTKYFLKNKEEWINNYDANNLVQINYSFHQNNEYKHFELLRFIIYQLCNHKNDKDYLIFIKQLLFTLLEENAISLEHKVNENEKLYKLLSIPELYQIFDHGDGTIRVSNTKVSQLLDLIEEDNSVCDKIYMHINNKKTYTIKTSKIKPRYNPYSKKGGRKSRKTKNNKKSRKTKKSRKSRKCRKGRKNNI